MEFGVLGPLEVRLECSTVPLGGTKQRSVLAMLVLSAGSVVSVDELIDGVWGDEPHARAPATLQVYVSTLRRLLQPTRAAPSVLRASRPGYVLDVDPTSVDLRRFEARTAAARADLAGGHPGQAAAELAAALDLWRGPPLADLAGEPFARFVVPRLEEARVLAYEDWAEQMSVPGASRSSVALEFEP